MLGVLVRGQDSCLKVLNSLSPAHFYEAVYEFPWGILTSNLLLQHLSHGSSFLQQSHRQIIDFLKEFDTPMKQCGSVWNFGPWAGFVLESVEFLEPCSLL